MHEVWVAALSLLAFVRLVCEPVGSLEQIDVGIRLVGKHALCELFERDDSGVRDGRR
jgi:hypothetical protein